MTASTWPDKFAQCQECKMWDIVEVKEYGGITRDPIFRLIPLDGNNNPYPDGDKVVKWVCRHCFRDIGPI